MSQSPYSILLVDDDDSIHRALGNALREEGYFVADAANAEIGFQMFSAQSFDAVITDRTMPRMTGEQLTQKIKADSPNTPVILITACVPATTREKLFSEVLQKPFAKREFLDAVERVLPHSK
jgi:DNA-binding NtrC family response regulator